MAVNNLKHTESVVHPSDEATAHLTAFEDIIKHLDPICSNMPVTCCHSKLIIDLWYTVVCWKDIEYTPLQCTEHEFPEVQEFNIIVI